MSIELTPPFNNYAVLAGRQITNTGATVIRNGNLGSPGGTSPNDITYVNAVVDNTVNATTAQNQLQATFKPAVIYYASIPSEPGTDIDGAGNYIFYQGGFTTAQTLQLNTENTFIFDALSNADAQFFIHAGRLVFVGGNIILINGAQAQNIFWVSDTEITTQVANMTVMGNLIATTIVTLAIGTNIIGRVVAQTGAVNLLSNVIDLPITPEPPVPCYLKGTQILTNKGYVCIENLKVGDLIMTAGDIHGNKHTMRVDKYRPIIWMGHFIIDHPDGFVKPICIKKNTYGPNLPMNNVYVSPNHNLVVHGKLVPAVTLIDGRNILRTSKSGKIDYYHIELDKHSVIYAEGILSESYININNRRIFKQASHIKQYGKKKNFKK